MTPNQCSLRAKNRVQRCTASFKDQWWKRSETLVLLVTLTQCIRMIWGKYPILWVSMTSSVKWPLTSTLTPTFKVALISCIVTMILFLRGTHGPPVGRQAWQTSAPPQCDPSSASDHFYFIHLHMLRATVHGWDVLNTCQMSTGWCDSVGMSSHKLKGYDQEGTCIGCGLGSQLRYTQKVTDRFFFSFKSMFLSLPSPLSKKVSKHVLGWGLKK